MRKRRAPNDPVRKIQYDAVNYQYDAVKPGIPLASGGADSSPVAWGWFDVFIILNWMAAALVFALYLWDIPNIGRVASTLRPQLHGTWIGAVLGTAFYAYAWNHVKSRLGRIDERLDALGVAYLGESDLVGELPDK